jgi:hypothetical protein
MNITCSGLNIVLFSVTVPSWFWVVVVIGRSTGLYLRGDPGKAVFAPILRRSIESRLVFTVFFNALLLDSTPVRKVVSLYC